METAKKQSVLLSEEEANALLQIIDTAVKAGGLSLASNGVYFSELIKKAFVEPQPEEALKIKK